MKKTILFLGTILFCPFLCGQIASADSVGAEAGTIAQSTESSIISDSPAETTESTAENLPVDDEQGVTEETNDAVAGFYMPSGRSDLQPAISAFATIPDVAAADTNTPTKSFIDVSSHNGYISVEQYASMKKYGVSGVVVKLTESTSYTNPYAADQIKNAISAGLKVSVYHYSWFTTDDEARAEADSFAAVAIRLGLPASTLMVNDLEEPKIADKGNHTLNSKAFAARLQAYGFTNVTHYTGLYWLTLGRIDAAQLGYKNIWVAAYPYTLTKGDLYQEYGAWQWSSRLTFPNVNGYFDISADYTGQFTYVEATPPVGTTAMHRLYNSSNYEHFYTKDIVEKDHLVNTGWGKYEGIAWYAPTAGNAVYRLYNKYLKDHHYTLDQNEVKVLTEKHGWTYEGIAWYSDPDKSVPIYRLFNPTLTSGSHHFTTDMTEVNVLKTRGWKYEGPAWYGK